MMSIGHSFIQYVIIDWILFKKYDFFVESHLTCGFWSVTVDPAMLNYPPPTIVSAHVKGK